MWFGIPLSGSDEQFSISILGNSYTFQILYRGDPYDTWVMNIFDASGNGLVAGIPLVTGCDLLSPFSTALGLAFSLFVATDGSPSTPPTSDNLGTSSHLYVRT